MAGWGLTRIVRGEYGKYNYSAVVGRFKIAWERRQGARDVWVVSDTKVGKSVRADNLTEVRVHVAEVMRSELRAEFPSPTLMVPQTSRSKRKKQCHLGRPGSCPTLWTCRGCGAECCEHRCLAKVGREATCGECSRRSGANFASR